jgi:hypothetical protein
MFRVFAAALICCVVTGCAAIKPMAFDKSTTVLDTKEKSILLMTVEVSRSDESRYVPEPFNIGFETPTAQSSDDRHIFRVNKHADAVQDNGKTVYLARLAFVGGEYKLQSVMGMASAFPFNAMFVVPLGIDVKVKPNSVTYVGRLKAQMRRREKGEFRAGPVVPLIDQAAAGMVRSTWEVSVDNNAEKDLALFRENYPVLKGVNVETGPMLKFDRAVAQRLWEGTSPGDKKDEPADGAAAPAAAAPQ